MVSTRKRSISKEESQRVTRAPAVAVDATKSYIDIHQLTTRTGLSVATIHRLKAQGKIPFFQPAGKGGKLLFPPDALERAPGPTPPAAQLGSSEPQGRLSGPAPAWMRPTP